MEGRMGVGAKLCIVGLVCGLTVAHGFAQDAKPATEKHRLEAALRQLKKDGLHIPYPDGVFPDQQSRYEIAVVVHAASQLLETRLAQLEAIAGASAGDVPRLDESRTAEDVRTDVARLGAWGKDAKLLEELARELDVEIASLGVDVPGLVRELQRAEVRCRDLAPLGPAIAAKVTPFPDNAGNHWAFAAFTQMKDDGIPVSYPGRRAAIPTRAQAVLWTLEGYDHIGKAADDLESQIKKISARLDANPSEAERQAVRDELGTLQVGVNRFKDWTDDIRNLVKLVRFFAPEIEASGRDVEAVKKSLGDLVDRCVCPDYPPAWLDMHGTMDLVALSGRGQGLTVDGRPMSGSAFLHQGAVRLNTTNRDGITAVATVVFGDTFSRPSVRGPFGNQSDTLAGEKFGQGSETAYVQEAWCFFETETRGWSQDWVVGRLSMALGRYFYQRPDTTPLYDNAIWDDGKWTLDGARMGTPIGRVSVTAFGGFAPQFLTGWIGEGLQPMRVGRDGGPWNLATASSRPMGLESLGQVGMPVDEVYGVQLGAPVGRDWTAQLVGVWLDADRSGLPASGKPYNRLGVGGLTFGGSVGRLELEAGVGASTLTYNEHRAVDTDNRAWWLDGSYGMGCGKVNAGYREIGANYAAPGDWGRVGLWWNPTDLKGFTLGGDVGLSERLEASVGGEWYTGIDDGGNDWGSGQKVDRYTAELKWHPGSCWRLAIGGEHVRYHGLGGSEPTEQWLTLRAEFGIINNMRFIATWQTGRVSADGASAFRIGGRDLSSGNVFVGQLSFQF